MAKRNHFDVMKEMAARNLDIRLAPLDNVSYVQKVKAGTKVTIGVGGDVMGIAMGHFTGGLILCDSKQFDEIWTRMKKEDASGE